MDWSSLLDLLLLFSLLPASILSQLQSSTMKLLSNSSGSLCAADRASTVFQARSLIDCQQRCTKNKCYVNNFYSDTKTCEVYNFKPATLTTNRKNCKSFRNSNVWPDYHDCLIKAVACGFADNVVATDYISVNGIEVWNHNTRYMGFITTRLDPISCSTSSIVHYDTYASQSESNNMAAYINSLPMSTVLIGVTFDEASFNLNANAKTALAAIGVDVNALVYRGKVAFVAQIGQPTASVSVVGGLGDDNAVIKVIARGFPLQPNVTLIRQ